MTTTMDVILQEKLNKGIVLFTFLKKDGTHRLALGTRNVGLLSGLGFDNAETEGNRKPSPSVLVYFDLQKEDWRCCLRTNVLDILRTDINEGELICLTAKVENINEGKESAESISRVEYNGKGDEGDEGEGGIFGGGIIYGTSTSGGEKVETEGGEPKGESKGGKAIAVEMPNFGEMPACYVPINRLGTETEQETLYKAIERAQAELAAKQAELNALYLQLAAKVAK